MSVIQTTLQVLTNLSCNLNCTYCYEHKDNVVNDIDRIKTFLYIKFKLLQPEQHEVVIDLIGGESFLVPDLCDQIIEYGLELAKKFNKCVHFSTSSNGTTLKNPKVRELIEKYKDRLSVGISIDGIKENHDKYRVYHDGRGSYEDAIKYLPWLFETLGKNKVGVKATFTLESFKKYYYESMVNIHQLGFDELAGNIVYEDIIPMEEAHAIFAELKKVLDYILKHDLEDIVSIMHIGKKENAIHYIPYVGATESWCGTCVHMSCFGIDGLVYGCNRFHTMNKPGMELGSIDKEKETINTYNIDLLESVKEVKKSWDGQCASCFLRAECPTCVAAIYEAEDKEQYIREKRQCGWTHAFTMAKFYYKSQLINKEKSKGEL